jgi:V/A-type H+-transporting ATPase subunit F
MEKRWYGILLVLPAPERVGVEVEDYAMSLIKRAIGYHVRLKL